MTYHVYWSKQKEITVLTKQANSIKRNHPGFVIVSLCIVPLPSYLKCVGRVVHTVDPEGKAQRVARIRTTKHSQSQPLGCLLVLRLPHQGVAARMLQQHMAPLGLQQTVAGRALLVHRHHFLWREDTSGET